MLRNEHQHNELVGFFLIKNAIVLGTIECFLCTHLLVRRSSEGTLTERIKRVLALVLSPLTGPSPEIAGEGGPVVFKKLTIS